MTGALSKRRAASFLWLALTAACLAWGQSGGSDAGLPGGRYTDEAGSLLPFVPALGRVLINERSDFSRYENNRYVGLLARQSFLSLEARSRPQGGLDYSGEAFVIEETLRANRSSAALVRESLPIAFSLLPGGGTLFSRDTGYPILRGVPAPPPQALPVGARWTSEATVVVRPRAEAPATRIRVLVEYEYRGLSRWEGREAIALWARYALRYRGDDRQGDPALRTAQGGRTADIYVDPVSGSTLFIRETVDDSFAYADGSSLRLKGFILHFHKGSLPGERGELIASLGGGSAAPGPAGGSPSAGALGGSAAPAPAPGPVSTGAGTDSPAGGAASSVAAASGPQGGASGAAGDAGVAAGAPSGSGSPPSLSAAESPGPGLTPAYELAQSERGVVLILYDLRFAPDSAELLSGEKGRLDAIAAALKKIPDRNFLIEGHAADLGRPQGQYELSEARAKRIVDELTARGIQPARLIYRGRGADMPVAGNDTEAGRARNRRVEITVLD
jgi:outer membrane protein OmpA-like peptidoglycan-associated protein